ncbi:MAG: hypothetical protein ABI091_06670 [Ferruginibacter sp.]
MRKAILFITLLLTAVTAFQCNKKDNKIEDLKDTTVSKWTLNDKKFTASAAKWDSEWYFTGNDSGSALVAKDAASKFTIAAGFSKRPAVSGFYKICSSLNVPDGEVLLELTDGTYWYFSTTGGTADVEIVNGKIKITYSNITLSNGNSKTSGVLVEQ